MAARVSDASCNLDCMPDCETSPMTAAFGASSALGTRVGSIASPFGSMLMPVRGAAGLCAPAVVAAGSGGVVVAAVGSHIGAPMHQPGAHPNAGAMANSQNQAMARAFAATPTSTAPASAELQKAAAKSQSIFDAIGPDRIKTETRLTSLHGSAAVFANTPSKLVDSPLSGMVAIVNDPLTGARTEHTSGLAKKISIVGYSSTALVPVGLKFAAAQRVEGQCVVNATNEKFDFVVMPTNGQTHMFPQPEEVYRNDAVIEADLAERYSKMSQEKMIAGCVLHTQLPPPAFTVPETAPIFPVIMKNIEKLTGVKPENVGRYQGQAVIGADLVYYILSDLNERVHSKINPLPLDQLMTVTSAPAGGSWTPGNAFNTQVAANLGAISQKTPIGVNLLWKIEYAPY